MKTFEERMREASFRSLYHNQIVVDLDPALQIAREADEAIRKLQIALKYALHDVESAVFALEPKHICGPESSCDSNCASFSAGLEFLRRSEELIGNGIQTSTILNHVNDFITGDANVKTT